ncbi:fimbrial protein [Buttiauxella sp. B2]|uniref:fimbrial protein n=1 Tax=Buttiauxella sp. B2 TaxID=2587812 RepID=UPI001121CB0D|nr:fimbrial protein [Buttiauxella sp. B2]TNV10779.1 fimbrial protein [Buttiauxella sp. B2]
MRYITTMSVMLIAMLPLVSKAASTAKINIYGTLIEPASCTVNGGQDIDVPFGDDVITTKINGVSYKKMPLNYTVECNGDMSGASLVQISINGAVANFGTGLLQTNVTGLGVQFLNGTNGLALNTDTANYDYTTGQPPELFAVLAKDPVATLVAGAFTATATMSVAYQ